MKNKFILFTALAALMLVVIGCSGSISTNSGSSPSPSPSPSPSNSSSTGNTSAPKEVLKDEKKPDDVKENKVKNVPVPDSWINMYDKAKGYGFAVPEGTTGGTKQMQGIDIFIATTPAPNEIAIFVLSYKDKKKTKEDLLNDAVKFLEGMGLTVTKGKLNAESDDYAVADASTVAPDGTKEKQRILVGTDVTDNYVMILNTPADKFEANEPTIDKIWGSFEMTSGGASKN